MDLNDIVSMSVRLEQMLEHGYWANGNGLIDKLISVQTSISDDTAKNKIRRIARIRNAIVHGKCAVEDVHDRQVKEDFDYAIDFLEKNKIIHETEVSLRASNGMYVSCDLKDNGILKAAWATSKKEWEKFILLEKAGFYSLKSIASGKWVSVNRNDRSILTASFADICQEWEQFRIWIDGSRIHMRDTQLKWVEMVASNGNRLAATAARPNVSTQITIENGSESGLV